MPTLFIQTDRQREGMIQVRLFPFSFFLPSLIEQDGINRGVMPSWPRKEEKALGMRGEEELKNGLGNVDDGPREERTEEECSRRPQVLTHPHLPIRAAE